MALILSGKANAHAPSSSEEEDILRLSSKKIRNNDEDWPKLSGKVPKLIASGQTFAERVEHRREKTPRELGKRVAQGETLRLTYKEEKGESDRLDEDSVRGVENILEAAPLEIDPPTIEDDPFPLSPPDPMTHNNPVGLIGKFWSGPDNADCEMGQDDFADAVEDSLVPETPSDLGLLSMGFDGQASVPSVGPSGGLVVVWKSDLIDVVVCRQDRQYLHLKCCCVGRSPFFLTSVYSIPSSSQKQFLWNALEGFAANIAIPWVILGDFNDIAAALEKTGGSVNSDARYRRFTDRIRYCKLNSWILWL
ncbi:hypothetical protein K1719_036462 [Acacia pycnantha]|nr:hypothetical protein K1719_036462 [Acacia pycnantha]